MPEGSPVPLPYKTSPVSHSASKPKIWYERNANAL